MPALQVRDFPEELYRELKDYSALNHRSMAQQTVFAVDQMIHKNGCCANDACEPKETSAYSRLKKREEILNRAAERNIFQNKNIPLPSAVLSEARSDRDADFDVLGNEFLEHAE